MNEPLQLPYYATLHGTQLCLVQAFAEDFCESLLSRLVTKKRQNSGAVTINDVDDLYQLISIEKGGHRVNVWKIPNSFVKSVCHRLTAYLNGERVYVP